ncbi:hypothetical protein VB734_04025 [Synechococcus sp. BA-124 BA4]|uniref:hypothetical protein n=1 Tax=unclassified Synechococcus TaxID=2626047 RepID=UPI002AD5129D|nr:MULTISPECIES: hypothetical protein [unclassified Synechococcus]MEA5399205.1 hypothetical protein [Synechococcus sp. BA-124 BA4]
MPLSLATAMVLVLSSLSVLTAALHGNHLAAAELLERQIDDEMASAAEQVAARLSGPYSCLLPVASAAWIQPVTGCPVTLDPAGVLRGQVGQAGYRVVSWKPPANAMGGEGESGQLRLEGVERGGSRLYGLGVALVAQDLPALHVVSVRRMGR